MSSDDNYDDDYNSDDYNSDDNNGDDEYADTNDGNDKNYTVLSEADIRQRQVDNIDMISSVLSIPKEAARVLLLHYRWITTNVHEAWFCNKEKISKSLGLYLDDPIVTFPDTKKTKCGICYEKKRTEKFTSTSCGHLFCVQCWMQYAATSINDGPGCLMLRCPDPKCRITVPHDMIDLLVADVEVKNKYAHFLIRSYVEGNPKIKWCPSPGCEYAIEYDGERDYDVTCTCSYGFCWNCTEESHRPVDCNTVGKWVTKNKAESENTMWILAYTKPCPKCKCTIEKNKGCMHMTCPSPCEFQFCWLCLEPWAGHKGFYDCNRYQEAKREGTLNEDERTRENAKNSIDRYTHYFERWAANNKSREKALKDLHTMKTENLDKLCCILSESMGQLTFVTEAWEQIVECRRVLKWTYAYGYYLPEEDRSKKNFFEYLQGEAEGGLERLHDYAETELGVYLNADKPLDGFNDFRIKLIELTTATRTYFKNMVKALEDGLSEVDTRKSK